MTRPVPLHRPALISRAVAAAKLGAAVPGLALSDTVKAVDAREHVTQTLDRVSLRAIQTPQAFNFGALLAAHRDAAAAGRDDFSDDAALMEWAGHSVAVFAGEAGNVKLTMPEDFARVESGRLAMLADMRMGTGYDVHAFSDGDHVMLGGVKIPHTRGLAGHSDADAVLHALVDAILGALAEGDIGVHFPPSDPQWRGAASEEFLRFAGRACAGARRHDRASRRNRDLRGPAHRAAPRRDPRAHRRHRRPFARSCGGEGNHQRKTRLHRPWRRHRGAGNGDHPPALERLMADREMLEAAQALLDLCARKKLTLGLAESCTGGMLAATLTEIPGSSRVLDRGYVTYSNEAKQQIGVAAATIERYGAVSRETAEAMAKGVLANAPVTLSASVTGIAGPDGGTREKPVGLVHFAVAASRSGKLIHHEHHFGEIGRAQVRRALGAARPRHAHDSRRGRGFYELISSVSRHPAGRLQTSPAWAFVLP